MGLGSYVVKTQPGSGVHDYKWKLSRLRSYHSLETRQQRLQRVPCQDRVLLERFQNLPDLLRRKRKATSESCIQASMTPEPTLGLAAEFGIYRMRSALRQNSLHRCESSPTTFGVIGFEIERSAATSFFDLPAIQQAILVDSHPGFLLSLRHSGGTACGDIPKMLAGVGESDMNG